MSIMYTTVYVVAEMQASFQIKTLDERLNIKAIREAGGAHVESQTICLHIANTACPY